MFNTSFLCLFTLARRHYGTITIVVAFSVKGDLCRILVDNEKYPPKKTIFANQGVQHQNVMKRKKDETRGTVSKHFFYYLW